MHSYSALLSAFFYTLVLLLGIAIVTLVGKWKVYAKLGMRSVVPFGWQAAFCAARTRAYDPLATLADL